MPPRKTVSVIVSIDDTGGNDFEKVARNCRAAGLEIHETLEFLGQLIGDIEVDQRSALEKVRGVTSVEVSGDYQLPPPGSDIQ